MNKVAIVGCGHLATECRSISDRLQENGISVTIVSAPSFPKEEIISYSCLPILDPMPFFEKAPGGTMIGRDSRYYANNTAKRRKKNKNKKTHRK